jgi:AcrR family transcriptional regulator
MSLFVQRPRQVGSGRASQVSPDRSISLSSETAPLDRPTQLIAADPAKSAPQVDETANPGQAIAVLKRKGSWRGRPRKGQSPTRDAPIVAAILRIASEEICDREFHGARVDSIARKAGGNKPLIYRLFGSKDGLYLEVLAEHMRRFERAWDDVSLVDDVPLAAIHRVTKFCFEWYRQNPEFVRLMGVENIHRAKYLNELTRKYQFGANLLCCLENIIQMGKLDGSLRQDIDAKNLYLSITALCVEANSNHWRFGVTEGLVAAEEFLVLRGENIALMIERYVVA